MITIFNGRSRTLGEAANARDVYVQVNVGLRDHLHHFKGAKLHVLMAVALHSDINGWSHPSIKLMRRETGLDCGTIANSLTELCETKIDGHRVLLRKKTRDRGGRFSQNRYLIFPTKAEVARYETPPLAFEDASSSGRPGIGGRKPVETSDRQMSSRGTGSQKTDTVNSQSAKSLAGETRLGINKDEVEPCPDKNRGENNGNHTHQGPSEGNVNVKRLTLENYLEYAMAHRATADYPNGIRSPLAWVTVAMKAGKYDGIVRTWYSGRVW